MAPRETENNAYAKFWCDKKRALWYVMVFSGVVNFSCLQGGAYSQWQSTFWVYGYLATEQSRHDKHQSVDLISAIWQYGLVAR